MTHRFSAPFLLFVYGTLRPGGVRHYVLAADAHLGPAKTAPVYALLHLGSYPGMVRDEASGYVVRGDLYDVSPDRLALLDAVEGAPDLFALDRVELDGVSGEVWSYFYVPPAPEAPRIASGVWDNATDGDAS